MRQICNSAFFLIISTLLAGKGLAETQQQSVAVDWQLDDPAVSLQFNGFDTMQGQRELIAVELGFSGFLDLEVVVQNYSASPWEAEEWYFDAGADVVVAFEPRTADEDFGPFFRLGGVLIGDITGQLSAGSGGTPFDDPTPGTVDVSAVTSKEIRSTVRSEMGLDYFLSESPLLARSEPFVDFLLTPPLEEPQAFINGTAIQMAQEGVITLTYEYVQRLGRPEDCNGDGVVDALDLRCVCGSGSRIDDVLNASGLLQGDLNGDGEVAFGDFLTLAESFGNSGDYTSGDVDCSGLVDFTDFLILAENYAKRSATAASVPEPHGLAWALLGLLCLRTRLTR